VRTPIIRTPSSSAYIVNTVEAWQWDNQLEAASVAERVLKKIDAPWLYEIKPSECSPGWWAVRFKAA